MQRKIFFLAIWLIHFSAYSNNRILNLCVNDTELIPFVIFDKNEITGIRVDIIKEIIKNLHTKLNINFNINPMPWSRCLKMAEKGEIDAPIDVSYNDERSQYLDFPPDSGPNEKKACGSEFKLACSGYFVITLKSNKFKYNGKPSELPVPVRVTRGYSIVAELEKLFPNNLIISKSDSINVDKLISDKKGSVVAYTGYKSTIYSNKSILNQIKIHKTNYSSKSYYIPFSKKSQFSNNEKIMFWNELKNILNNKEIMDNIYKKYSSFKSTKK
jgi:polar amino acid transport system substrate-binding protein